MKSRKLIGVLRETKEEALKSLSIGPNVLARRLNETWDILLPTEKEARLMGRSILISKSERPQTEYIGTRRTRIKCTLGARGHQ